MKLKCPYCNKKFDFKINKILFKASIKKEDNKINIDNKEDCIYVNNNRFAKSKKN